MIRDLKKYTNEIVYTISTVYSNNNITFLIISPLSLECAYKKLNHSIQYELSDFFMYDVTQSGYIDHYFATKSIEKFNNNT